MPSLVATTSALARKPCVSTHYVRTNLRAFFHFNANGIARDYSWVRPLQRVDDEEVPISLAYRDDTIDMEGDCISQKREIICK